MKKTSIYGFGILAFFLILISAFFVFSQTISFNGIPESIAPAYRIFYFHIATALIPYLAFLVVFVASVLYLARRNKKYDMLAYASAEVGIVFDTMVLITGPIWARIAWGVWWVWEPRLTTSLIVWLLYVAYLLLRRSIIDEERKANFAAVFGIVAFLSVPINFMAIRWWRTIHPLALTLSGGGIYTDEPRKIIAFVLSLLGFLFLYLCLLFLRLSIDTSEKEIELLKEELEG